MIGLPRSTDLWGLVDCDGFYASCEALLDPSIVDKPICIGTDVIIARNYIAREYGIKVGDPIWIAKPRLPQDAVFLPARLLEYGRVSRRLMKWLFNIVNSLEQYSIDESFIEVSGMQKRYDLTYDDLARKMKLQIKRDIGIPVSIGLAPTRILAKIFADAYKPFGHVVAIEDKDIDYILDQTPLKDIPYIGRKRQERLQYQCKTALDFKNLDERWIRKEMGGAVWKIRAEINGCNARDPTNLDIPRNICRSRSFHPHFTNDHEELRSHLHHNFLLAHEHLMDSGGMCAYVGVKLRKKDFSTIYVDADLPHPTDNRQQLVNVVKRLYDSFELKDLYRTTGVVLGKITPSQHKPVSLFDYPKESLEMIKFEFSRAPNHDMLNETLHNLNKKFGRGTIQIGTAKKNSRLKPREFPVAFTVS